MDTNEWLLEEINRYVIGICSNQTCIAKAQATGLEGRFTLGGDFSCHHRRQESSEERRIICLYCHCDTVFQWTPTAVEDHFLEKHRDFMDGILQEHSRAQRLASQAHLDNDELSSLRRYKAQHDILERSLKESVKSLNEEVVKLQKDKKIAKKLILDLKRKNEKIQEHCIALQKSVMSSLARLDTSSQTPQAAIQFLDQLGKDIRAEGRDFINRSRAQCNISAMNPTSLNEYSNDKFIEEIRESSSALGNLVDLLEHILGGEDTDLAERTLKREKHINLVLSMILGFILSAFNDHYSFPLGTMICLEVRQLSKSTACVNLVCKVLPGGITDSGIANHLKYLSDQAKEHGLKIPLLTSIIICWDNLGTYVHGSSRATSGTNKRYKVTTTRVLYHLERLNKPLIQDKIELGPWNDRSWDDAVPENYWEVKMTKQRYATVGDVGDDLTEQQYLEDEIDGYCQSLYAEMICRENPRINVDISSLNDGSSLRGQTDSLDMSSLSIEEREKRIEELYPVCCPVVGCERRYRATGRIVCEGCNFRVLPLAAEARALIESKNIASSLLKSGSGQVEIPSQSRWKNLKVQTEMTPTNPNFMAGNLKQEPSMKIATSSALKSQQNSMGDKPMDKSSKAARRIEQVAGCTIQNTKISTQVLPSLDVNPNSYVTIRWVMISFFIILGMITVADALEKFGLSSFAAMASHPSHDESGGEFTALGDINAAVLMAMNSAIENAEHVVAMLGVDRTESSALLLATSAAATAAGSAALMHLVSTYKDEPNILSILFRRDLLAWIWAVSDEGAADFDFLDVDPHCKRIRQMFGPGHAWAVILRVVLGVLWNYGLEPLAQIYGYTSQKAQECLKAAANLRKSRDFLKCVRKGLTNAYLREYINWSTENFQSGPASEAHDYKGFLCYRDMICSASSTDVVLRNIDFIVFRVLPAFDLIEKAMRNNHMASFWAGVLFLLPLLVLRNCVNYVPLLLREVAIYQYCCPDAVLEEYKLIWCFFGQGLDFILEEVNRRIKRHVTRGSYQEYLVASIQHDQQLSYKKALESAIGIKVTEVYGEHIEGVIDQDEISFQMEKFLITHRICRYDPSRTVMKTIDGSKLLLPGSGLVDMLDVGRIETRKYAMLYRDFKSQRAAPKPKLPPAYAMTEDENKNSIQQVSPSFVNTEQLSTEGLPTAEDVNSEEEK